MKLSIFIYFCLILPIFSINWLEVLENTLDKNVGVCDNLYRHVCPQNKTDGFSQIVKQEFRKDFEKYKIPENFEKIKEEIETLIETIRNNTTFDLIFEKSEKFCQENRDEFRLFLEQLESLIRNENIPCEDDRCFVIALENDNCTDVVEFIKFNLKKNFDLAKEEIKFVYLPIDATDVLQSFEWIKNNTEVFDRINSTIAIIKALTSEKLRETPWIKNNNLTRIFENISKKLYLPDPEIIANLNIKRLTDYESNLNKCSKNVPSDLISICHLHTIKNMDKKDKYALFSGDNAFNSYPIMGFGLAFAYYAKIDLPPAFYLGSIAQIVAHEVGHTYIVSERGDNFLPYFSNDTRNCIQNQFTKSCEYFAEGECKTSDIQFDDNGADSFSFEIMYQIFKAFYGETMNDEIIGSKIGMTHAQLYFYSHGTTLCSPKPRISYPKGSHHASNVRINSGAAQNLDFGKTFNCAPNSKMIESRAEKCYIFGENAAETRF
ncbi:unnamed protein product [Caenorhabditis angaria]|uniref:Peptidase M13 C-terminal domain-containing protein n=1 Tax=Caenorhabditis angaria TaxID=860376 RepID=A0A9P1MX83_9PELO|nr:unnamed protein product [Caenorhabditis angaria]